MAAKEVDKAVDHTATVHNYWMGGKDHITASWEAATSWPANVWLVKRGIKVPI